MNEKRARPTWSHFSRASNEERPHVTGPIFQTVP